MSGRKEVERAEWEGAEEWQGEAAAVGLVADRFAGDWCPPPLLLHLSFLSPFTIVIRPHRAPNNAW